MNRILMQMRQTVYSKIVDQLLYGGLQINVRESEIRTAGDCENLFLVLTFQ